MHPRTKNIALPPIYYMPFQKVLHWISGQPLNINPTKKMVWSNFDQKILNFRILTSPKATPGTYRAHTKWTHLPTSVSLNMPPLLGQSSQEGFSIPALQASQNQGAD